MYHEVAENASVNRKRTVADSVVRRYLHRALSLRDVETAEHTHRVGTVSAAIGIQMGISPHEARELSVGGILHDIGKLGTPDAVLLKNGLYDDQDRAIIRSHCQDGFDILRGRVTHDAAMVALCHHERYDGTGYPSGLASDEIPLNARVCAVADYFDAATSEHGGRASLSALEAADEIAGRRGTWFDPIVVDAFLRAYAFKAFDALPPRWT